MKSFKLSLIAILPIFAIFMLTGCGSAHSNGISIPNTNEYCMKNKYIDKSACETIVNSNVEDIYLIDGISKLSAYGFKHKSHNNVLAATIQAAAETTLLKDKKYFAILSPAAMSNLNGVLINTPEEYFKKCEITMGDVLTFQTNKCGLIPRNNNGIMTIKVFSERPHDILVYDANEVIKYLKTNGKYDEDGKVKKIVFMK
ncbi:hypothetical protein [Arcobacter sp. F2176]|uniref:hypothetical protein n=1 Tax=Arcobacter sp. F2176 TaxID=2044511 RepID=UPI00100A9079|nr:hypothetical protein [Arcobacter sp. F2176]RXJ79042.1 hypothetical protein CRU95_15305 [Arcobacter sp. F2176]